VNESGRAVLAQRIARNSVLNLSTIIVISGLNLVFVPLMLHAFGTELYGVLSFTWAVLANLSWLDLGFGRTSTRFVAQELEKGRPTEACFWTWTALIAQAALGSLGAALLWTLAPFLVEHIRVSGEVKELVILTLRLFAFALPIDFATKSMTGVLQAGQRFDWVNGLNVFSAVGTFVVYTAGIIHGHDFYLIVYGLFVARIASLAGAFWGATHVLPGLTLLPNLTSASISYSRHVWPMLRYGSWLTVASVIGPLILYFDQSIISIAIGVALLPLYTVPFNLLWRLVLVPTSLTTTLFPAFSALSARDEWQTLQTFFLRANRYVLIITTPLIFVLYVWAPEILRLWIDASFAANATVPFRLLAVGYILAVLAPLSGATIEAIGRPDLLAKIYLLELPCNAVIVWVLTDKFGIPGAALSFAIRAIVETVIVWLALFTVAPLSGKLFFKEALLMPGLAVIPISFMAYVIGDGEIHRLSDIGLTTLTVACYSVYALAVALDRQDRQFIATLLRGSRVELLWKP
jgi:O-antigen/teichoic acid export membrane protein